jgi:signal transduction histidine kinase
VFNPAMTRSRNWDRIDEPYVLRTLNSFAVDLIGIPSSEDLFWYVAQNVVGRLNFVDCVIYQADEADGVLRQVAAGGEKNPFARSIINPLVIPFGRGITGQVAATGAPMIVDDLLLEQDYIPDLRLARSEICVPLVHRGRIIGVIDCEHPDPHGFGEAELDILTTSARMTAAKLEVLEEADKAVERYRDLVSAHARLTEEITAHKALDARLSEARRIDSLGRLTGRFAHEFNNMLTVISGNLEFLETEVASADARLFLDDARTAAGRATSLMQDMLVFAERTRLEPAILDLNALVMEFCLTHGDSLARGIDLALADDLWPVSADRKAIECMLYNLVANARDATASGGTVLIQTTNTLQAWADDADAEILPGRYARLSVIDTGAGIPEDLLSRIFDPFYTTKPIGTARGLGLSVVRGLARQSGGAVAVSSAPGKGSTFAVFLPASCDDVNRSAGDWTGSCRPDGRRLT